MNKKEIITVQFNSNYKRAGDTDGDANYYIDWSAILKDNQPYLLNYSFFAQRNFFVTPTKIASLYINIYGENYIASGITGNRANPTNLLCSLDVINLGANTGNFFVNSNTKNQIFLNSRPTNNNVNIKVLNNDAIPIIWSEAGSPATQISDYILTLTFSEI